MTPDEIMAAQLRQMERLNAQLAEAQEENRRLLATLGEVQAELTTLSWTRAHLEAAQEENRQLRQHIANLETSCANLRTLARAAGEELNQLKAKRKL